MTGPLTFEPLFQERVWGGRRLEERFGRDLPAGAVIGESWELSDRPGAESVVDEGPLAGRTLGELWRGEDRRALFGSRAVGAGERFPLLVKLLDCEQTLSVQVHPPADVAAELGGEPKTEMWVVLDAEPGAHVLLGLRRGVGREAFEAALRGGEDVTQLLHRVEVGVGDVVLLPSGRVHAIGGGLLLAEIQQNSDTTFRVYDYDRPGLDGRPRALHVAESLQAIDWADAEPGLVVPQGEALVHGDVFEVDRLRVDAPRPAGPQGECAAVCALDGTVACGARVLTPGRVALVPADAGDQAVLRPVDGPVTVLRAMLGPRG